MYTHIYIQSRERLLRQSRFSPITFFNRFLPDSARGGGEPSHLPSIFLFHRLGNQQQNSPNFSYLENTYIEELCGSQFQEKDSVPGEEMYRSMEIGVPIFSHTNSSQNNLHVSCIGHIFLEKLSLTRKIRVMVRYLRAFLIVYY